MTSGGSSQKWEKSRGEISWFYYSANERWLLLGRNICRAAKKTLCEAHHHKNSYRIGRVERRRRKISDQLTCAIDSSPPTFYAILQKRGIKKRKEAGSWQIGPHHPSLSLYTQHTLEVASNDNNDLIYSGINMGTQGQFLLTILRQLEGVEFIYYVPKSTWDRGCARPFQKFSLLTICWRKS